MAADPPVGEEIREPPIGTEGLASLVTLGASGASSEFFAGIDTFNLTETALVIVDVSGSVRRVNSAFSRFVGRLPEELLGDSVSWVGSPEDMRRLRDLHQQIGESEHDGTVSSEMRYARLDGSVVWVDLTILPLRDDRGVVTGFFDRVVDITQRKLAEEAEAREFDMLEQAQHIAHVGSFEFDPRKDEFDASTELRRLLGFKEGDPATIASLIEVVHPDDRARLGAAIADNLKIHAPVNMEHRLLTADGTLRWVHARVEWVEAGPDGAGHVLGTVLDISDRKLAEDALAFEGTHDQLTGLSNRTSFLEHVDHALAVAQRQSREIAVLLLDVDDFKHVNDGLGHVIGDQLLVALSRRVVRSARGRDVVARLGGDEFGLLIKSGQAAEEVAQRIIGVLRAPFALGEHQVRVSASIGVAFNTPQSDASALLRDADLAMYAAKQNGKGRFEVAQAGMHDRALARLVTIEELQHGVKHHEFEVFYQAIVVTETSALTGAEALVRWNNPRLGLVLPGLFIELAEESGLIVAVGREVRRDACRQLAAWRSDGVVDDSFYVSVNLSARQLADETLVENVSRDLAESGIPARALVLEITESAVVVDRSEGLSRLNALRERGLRLALDDYGTGYSSLSRLAEMPVDIVKIDKSFIDRLVSSGDGPALVKSVVDAAVALHMTTVAEGVEDEGQHRVLAELGCTYIQGYLFAMPVPAARAAQVFEELRGGPRARFREVGDPNAAAESLPADQPPVGPGLRWREKKVTLLKRHGTGNEYSELALNPSLVGSLFPLIASVCLLASLPFSHIEFHRSLVTLLCAATAGVVIGGVRFVYRARMPQWTINLDVALGDLFIVLCIIEAGGQLPYAIFFLWTSLIVALYFRPLLAFSHVGAVGVSYAIALWFGPSASDPAASWILVVVSSAILSGVTVSLVKTLRRMTVRDQLTGLANRRAWDQRLVEEMERARRSHTDLSLAMIDIDGFKRVNDRYGHLAGDALLCDFADGFKEVVREGGDFLVRLGGDEFGVIAPDTSQMGVQRLAQRLEEASPRGFSCSVGVATWENTESADHLLHRADEAMYRTKSERRTTRAAE